MSTKEWTKEQEIALINKTQNEYIDELIEKIFSEKQSEKAMKFINFTSPTGTGKTKMMSKLINKLPNCFFIITTLSRGHLNKQVEDSITKDCIHNNYIVYGAMSYTKSSILTEQDIFNKLPPNKPIFWLRDEGHINTNNWSKTLTNKCDKIINFSATNKEDGGIVCNFTHTMMLRTVNQQQGTIEDAINKLLEVKKSHKNVSNYNPCAIFRVVNSDVCDKIESLCRKYNLQTISIVDNSNFDMQDLCKDDNPYDVIINKQKIVEGIDIRRAHILWMENEPSNPATTIQVIGRCRRNALLWRDDIDILSEKNRQLLNDTRQCFVFYNVLGMKISNDENGELSIAFCPYISVEKLKTGHTIYVKDGQMENGLYVIELMRQTGYYEIKKDVETGFNYVDNQNFYSEQKINMKKYDRIIKQTLSNCYCKPREFGNTIIKSATEFLHFNLFVSETFELIHNKIVHNKYYPRIKEDGTFLLISSNILNTTQINEQDECLYKNIIKFKKYYKYTKIDQIELFNPETIININELHYFLQNYTNATNLETPFYDDVNTETINNKLLTILGCDEYKPIKKDNKVYWIPQTSVTGKLEKYTKLNHFISSKYKKEIELSNKQTFSNQNNFNFDKKFNSCFGYCVEYYAKYLLFGKEYIQNYIGRAKDDFVGYDLSDTKDDIFNAIIVRACMLKYKQNMTQTFGDYAGRLIRQHSCITLLKNKDFVNKVIELGTKTAKFISNKIDIEKVMDTKQSLITNHIVGLTDIMSKDTIIDIKCTNTINEKMIKQVLTYHFLSQFRTDLRIKNLIIYDAVSGKYIEIDVSEYINQNPIFYPQKKENKIFYYGTNINQLYENFVLKTYEQYIKKQTVGNLLEQSCFNSKLFTNKPHMKLNKFIKTIPNIKKQDDLIQRIKHMHISYVVHDLLTMKKIKTITKQMLQNISIAKNQDDINTILNNEFLLKEHLNFLTEKGKWMYYNECVKPFENNEKFCICGRIVKIKSKTTIYQTELIDITIINEKKKRYRILIPKETMNNEELLKDDYIKADVMQYCNDEKMLFAQRIQLNQHIQ